MIVMRPAEYPVIRAEVPEPYFGSMIYGRSITPSY
ncbi:MAG: hypothetical protein JWQ98_2553 [Chlorobi bacterium]|nr:hypothetical protein [Chlorobiota bacterium]